MVLAALVTAFSLSAPAPPAAPPLTIVEPSHGDRLRGVVHVATTAPAGVTSVFFEWSRNGGRTWLPIGEDATAYDGFGVDWHTTGFDGGAIVRATDSAGRQTHVRLTIDNTAPRLSLRAPAVFSPNGDGVRDRAEVRVSADEIVSMTLQVVSPRRRIVYTQARDVSLRGHRARRLVWHGRLYSGEVRARDGVYAVRAVAVDAVGHRSERAVAVRVDTRAPRVVLRGIAPERVAGAAPVELAFSAADAGRRLRVRPVLYDIAGEPLRTYAVRAAAPGARTATLVPGDFVPGTYAAGVVVTDEAGNTTTSAVRRFLLVRPVQARVWGRFAGAGLRAALTFDDCNEPSAWGSILDTLERLQVTATFFCSGRSVAAFPQLALRTVRDGHAIGSHGWDHANFATLSYGGALQRLVADREIWWRLARIAPLPLFRPPYGAYTASSIAAAGDAGYSAVVLWDVDPFDWQRPGASAIEERVVSATRSGSIALMHTTWQTAAALPSIVARLRARGFELLTVPALAAVATPVAGHWPG